MDATVLQGTLNTAAHLPTLHPQLQSYIHIIVKCQTPTKRGNNGWRMSYGMAL